MRRGWSELAGGVVLGEKVAVSLEVAVDFSDGLLVGKYCYKHCGYLIKIPRTRRGTGFIRGIVG